jgi:glucose-1-phosphate thymidylyltransferase
MNAVILCAGFATRMYPLTQNFPKPLLEVAGRPVLDYLLRQLNSIEEISDVYVVCNNKFFSHFFNWAEEVEKQVAYPNLKLHLYNDGSMENDGRLGAAGDLQFVLEKMADPGDLLVAGGDNIFLFALTELWKRFRKGACHCVPALYEDNLESLRKTGVLEINNGGQVLRLHEKPQTPPTKRVCPALYFFKPSVRAVLKEFLATPGNHDAPGYFLDYLCQKEKVLALKVDAGRLDIGSLQTYAEADKLLTENSALAMFE